LRINHPYLSSPAVGDDLKLESACVTGRRRSIIDQGQDKRRHGDDLKQRPQPKAESAASRLFVHDAILLHRPPRMKNRPTRRPPVKEHAALHESIAA
jgi:hypothetical protein